MKNPEVGDDDGRTLAGDSHVLARRAAGEKTGAGHKVNTFGEITLFEGSDDEDFFGKNSNFTSAAATGKPDFRLVVIRADDRGINVPITVNLRTAEIIDSRLA